jgi:serine/threonine protein phosphatase PrpC
MYGYKEKHSRSSSNPGLLFSTKVKFSEPLNATRESSNEKYYRISKDDSINVSNTKRGLLKTSYNFLNSSDKCTIQVNKSNKFPSTLPKISKKSYFKDVKKKLFKENEIVLIDSKEKQDVKPNKLITSKSERRMLQIPSNNQAKRLLGTSFYLLEHPNNSKYQEQKTSNPGPYSKKRQKSSLIYTSQSLLNKDSSDEQKDDNPQTSIRRVQSFQGPYGKKKPSKSSLSIGGYRKIIKLKESYANEILKNANSARKTQQKYPIKLKEKELLKKYAFKSQPGKNEGKETKTNQDSCLIKYKINGLKNFNMFGILDGHGTNGHHVSKFVTEFIYNAISKHPEIESLTFLNEIYFKLKEDNYKIIRQAYHKAEEELKNCEFDSNFSGSTCNIVFQIGPHIICSNVGDSRAIIVTKEMDMISKYECTNLSVDHKPTIQSEKKRIIKKGGRVEQYSEYGIKSGPYRVWLKEENYPGLAMSRSIGDFVASTVGVIPEPEFMEHYIMGSTKYIIVASDGVWEFLDNLTVMQLTTPFYEEMDPQGLCDKVVEIATSYWVKEDIAIDDISIVAIFF